MNEFIVLVGGSLITARAMTPVMIPVLTASIMYGGVKFRLVTDSGFRPFFR